MSNEVYFVDSISVAIEYAQTIAMKKHGHFGKIRKVKPGEIIDNHRTVKVRLQVGQQSEWFTVELENQPQGWVVLNKETKMNTVVWQFNSMQERGLFLQTLSRVLNLFGSDFAAGFSTAVTETKIDEWTQIAPLVERANGLRPERDFGYENPGLLKFQGPALIIRRELRDAMGNPYFWVPNWYYASHSGNTVVMVEDNYTQNTWRIVLDLGGGDQTSSFLYGERDGDIHTLDLIAAICPERRMGDLPEKRYY